MAKKITPKRRRKIKFAHSSYPWSHNAIGRGYPSIIGGPKFIMLVRSTDSHVPASERSANIRLMTQAPAQFLILELLRRNLARFEKFEFCFNGLRYISPKDSNWRGLVENIGYDKIIDALSA